MKNALPKACSSLKQYLGNGTFIMDIIGFIHTDFIEKFGIPRQSGLIPELTGVIEFLPEYRQPEAFKGLQAFSHIWILWEFNRAKKDHWSATVKPPKLGGNTRMGVFATRSPFRPNNIGLSSVRLERIEYTEEHGPLLYVSGIDMLDGTPILDIKPYIPYSDCHPDATGGFTESIDQTPLEVVFADEPSLQKILFHLGADKKSALTALLAGDPRPGYQNDPDRVYGVAFAGYNFRFTVKEKVITVISIEPLSPEHTAGCRSKDNKK